MNKIREGAESSWQCSGVAAREQLAFRASGTLLEHLRDNSQWYRDHSWV